MVQSRVISKQQETEIRNNIELYNNPFIATKVNFMVPTIRQERADECANCHKLTFMSGNTAKGLFYLCSQRCINSFLLKAGLKGYNTVRDHAPVAKPKPQTVGKLQELNAKELERIYRFKNNHSRDTMNKLKQGDSLDKLLGTMGLRNKPSKVQTTMPFTWTEAYDKAEEQYETEFIE